MAKKIKYVYINPHINREGKAYKYQIVSLESSYIGEIRYSKKAGWYFYREGQCRRDVELNKDELADISNYINNLCRRKKCRKRKQRKKNS